MRWLYGGVAAVALLAGLFLAWSGQQPPRVSALWLPEPRELVAFELTDDLGQPYGNDSLRGHWTLLFMGFTSCPDVCPSTMARLASAYPPLAQQLNLQVVLMSVDPQRDSSDRLHQYVGYFNPAFRAVTGEHSQLFALSRSLGLMYAMVDSDGADGYSVDHSADIVLINPQGQLEAIFRPQGGVGALRLVSMAHLKADLPAIARFRS
ncbi:protein SCO1/2 [Ferrimonas sediminum]|uniref:Protein SCO1/2 n=1 Tax=Ferrimonas sediminum TaxID=718193 RepID=A0A1G8ZK91_9GAMM|nr:SCO family protein [Ferrimonas sediminum]SDK15539.1 protein SCO1/2 [Ferrimonas sediminum]